MLRAEHVEKAQPSLQKLRFLLSATSLCEVGIIEELLPGSELKMHSFKHLEVQVQRF